LVTETGKVDLKSSASLMTYNGEACLVDNFCSFRSENFYNCYDNQTLSTCGGQTCIDENFNSTGLSNPFCSGQSGSAACIMDDYCIYLTDCLSDDDCPSDRICGFQSCCAGNATNPVGKCFAPCSVQPEDRAVQLKCGKKSGLCTDVKTLAECANTFQMVSVNKQKVRFGCIATASSGCINSGSPCQV